MIALSLPRPLTGRGRIASKMRPGRTLRGALHSFHLRKEGPSPLPAKSGERERRQSLRAFELERDVELGAVGFDLAFGIQLKVELDDFGDAQIAQRLAGQVDGGGRRF